MSDTTPTTVHTLYRPGDKVRFRFGHPSLPASAGNLYGTYEAVLTPDLWDSGLRAASPNYTLLPETVAPEYTPNLAIVLHNGSFGEAIYDVTLVERYGLPVRLLDKDNHADLFAGWYRNEVTHALVFTSTSTSTGSHVLTVPYTPSAVEAGWRIEAANLADCGLPADHPLLGEQGWWVDKGALREAGVKFPEDLPAEEPDLELERLRAEVERLTGENRRLAQADQDLRREVGTVAMRYAREHDWCDTVRDALDEVGIEPIDQKHEVWLTVRVKATGIARAADPSLDWTHHSISVDEYGIEQAITFDSDWEDVEVDFMEFEVDGVDLLEE